LALFAAFAVFLGDTPAEDEEICWLEAISQFDEPAFVNLAHLRGA
jgi:hypothetical protein